jgi:hypothetical protein
MSKTYSQTVDLLIDNRPANIEDICRGHQEMLQMLLSALAGNDVANYVDAFQVEEPPSWPLNGTEDEVSQRIRSGRRASASVQA